MRRSVRPSRWISLSRSLLKSCTFRTFSPAAAADDQTLVMFFVREVFLPVGSFCFFIFLQGFFLFVLWGGGRSFEGFSPSSQPQVGGVLKRRWHVWQSFGIDEWTVAVLQHGYWVPFHHLSPVSLELRPVPRGRYECWLFRRWLTRCSRRVCWRLSTTPALVSTALFSSWRR